MTYKALPETVDPIQLAKKATVFKGSLPLKQFVRVSDLLAGTDGEISYCLVFKMVEGFSLIDGMIEADVSMMCHRCMQVVQEAVVSDFSIKPVYTEEQAAVHKGDDVALMTDGKLWLHEILEDEMLLSLPMAVKHQSCSTAETDKIFETDDVSKASPFDALKQLNLKQ